MILIIHSLLLLEQFQEIDLINYLLEKLVKGYYTLSNSAQRQNMSI